MTTLSTKQKEMPSVTRAMNAKAGNSIVRRAIRHGLVPEFKAGVPLAEQTFETRWVLHVLAVMSKNGKPNIGAVKQVLAQTRDLVPTSV